MPFKPCRPTLAVSISMTSTCTGAPSASSCRRNPSSARRLRISQRFYVRSTSGKMIPVSEVVTLSGTNGPLVLNHFNLLRSADIFGGPASGYSSGQALQAMEEVAAKVLPPGFGYAWTTMAYQEKKAAGTAGPVFVFAIVMVFLLLAAQYESWSLPLGVVLSVPLGCSAPCCLCGAAATANDVYSSIGLILLVGLIAKNAILIVEFAAQQRREGKSIREAAIEAAHLRLRPILMTAFAFILGVVPLVLSSGAGAASRVSLGTAVFGGMLIGTIPRGVRGAVVLCGVPGHLGVVVTRCRLSATRERRQGSKKYSDRRLSMQKMVGAFGDVAGLSTGCMLGPDYQRPAVPVPAQYRYAEQPAPGREAVSLADLQWFALFQDERLQALVRPPWRTTMTCASPWRVCWRPRPSLA